MLNVSTLLIVDDDPHVSHAMASALHRPGRRIIVCNDAESAQLVLENTPVDALVADMKLSGPFRFEGIDLLEHARRNAPAARLIGMSGSSIDGLGSYVEKAGGSFFSKPFDTDLLEEIIPLGELSQSPPPICFVPTLRQIIADDMIVPIFQRIVTLSSGETRAVEALARLCPGSEIPDITVLFRYAERKQQTAELNLACLERALLTASLLPPEQLLFLNVDPYIFANGEPLQRTIFKAAAAAGIALGRVVLELTEQHSFPETDEAFETVEVLRAAGIRFAFDDLGVAYSHLPLVDRLRPSFFKISQQLGTGFEDDPTRMKIVRNLMALAADFECEVILEGIETEATASAARSGGITLGQGFLFDRTIGGMA
jgi:EAL domain-containing protein (putative c-di-GMP-specific phosphodiesterase class I)